MTDFELKRLRVVAMAIIGKINKSEPFISNANFFVVIGSTSSLLYDHKLERNSKHLANFYLQTKEKKSAQLPVGKLNNSLVLHSQK